MKREPKFWRLSGRFRWAREPTPRYSIEQPVRSELFSLDQLASHAKALAGWHEVDLRGGKDRLLPRLAENETVLLQAYELVTRAIESNRRITPAAEWLLDNFYLIEEQIRLARRHLPKGYSRQLPVLLRGPATGFPRVYDIAMELIAHVDGKVDPENVDCFVGAYQTVSELNLGELWAVPIMLRLALIENLRSVAAGIADRRRDYDNATLWADRLIETAERAPQDLVLVLAELARSTPPLSSPFVAEFARRLHGHSAALALPLTWLEQRLSEKSLAIEQVVQAEGQRQAAEQVSIANCIGSLRFLEAMDWRDFVEATSVVERVLRGDPAGVYERMEFATRDQYRHAVEELGKHSPLSEKEIAEAAVRLSGGVGRGDEGDRAKHVGFYLIGQGRAALERTVRLSPSVAGAVQRLGRRIPLALYLGGILLITVLFAVWVMATAVAGAGPLWGGALLFPALLLAASQVGVTVINWLATLVTRPRPLPRMDLSEGIPDPLRTLVVVPTMLVDHLTIDELLSGLEVRYLGNQDRNLYFALLTDFCDAKDEHLPEDQGLLAHAWGGIEALNGKYGGDGTGPFLLLHRGRRWNSRDQVWMGHERKRGKLEDLNFLLRGEGSERFQSIVGEVGALQGAKYVITLDTDTQLPREAARQLVGAIAHPLNQARYDSAVGRVVEGYGILQPRIGVSLPGANRSRFARLFSGEPGIDPYTRVVSDVYQDVFQEASFIGKGIYDVDAVVQCLGRRLPENLVLSHDLLEGAYARVGLLSDVLFYEDNPHHYSTDVRRRHRWIRGDWQISSWLGSTVPGADGGRLSNPLSPLSRWKILDNLRRSLVAPALLLLLVVGWFLQTPWLWTLAAVAALFAAPLLAALAEVVRWPGELPWGLYARHLAHSVGKQFGQGLYALVMLPHEACMSIDAVARTLHRLFVTRRGLLEWQTFSDCERNGDSRLLAQVRSMWGGPALAVAIAPLVGMFTPSALPLAGPLLLAWFISPLVAWWLSRPLAMRKSEITPEQRWFLRKTARRTWRFFETFVSAGDHWLPPDNYQEHPVVATAHRTSPTNMGIALLANLGAWDFGYLTAGGLLERTRKGMESMGRLERYRGHFYNWYDTRSLHPLHPQYVSTVDSGNLIGHLLILKSALEALPGTPVLAPRVREGLEDTLAIIGEVVPDEPLSGGAGGRAREIVQLIDALGQELGAGALSLAATRNCLERVGQLAADLAAALEPTGNAEATWWARALHQQCAAQLEEVLWLAPWLDSPLLEQSWGSEASGEERHFKAITDRVDVTATLGQMAAVAEELGALLEGCLTKELPGEFGREVRKLAEALQSTRATAQARLRLVQRLAAVCEDFTEVDYDFLLDRSRQLLAIGYNVDAHRRDNSYYDLLASEARLCSYIAIAQGRLSQQHWFALGRLLTMTAGEPVLLSWSGSMFEYFMPLLVMPSYENTLLDQTYRAVVQRQIDYGRLRGVPWGVSESGYNMTDVHLNYQYRAFGVPGLGLKRGLGDDLVVAPYASAMALMVNPRAACSNLMRIAAEGHVGGYGFYEAIDWTPSRVSRGQGGAAVRSFMAHHQGMVFLSMVYALLDRPMQRRFSADPMLRSAELLLQERIPMTAPFYPHAAEVEGVHRRTGAAEALIRVFRNPNTPSPEVHMLSNGRYTVMVTVAGGGFSRWKEISVTRWQEDATSEIYGSFCYVRDLGNGRLWSTAYQPVLAKTEHYEAIFSQARAEFRRWDEGVETHTEIAVSPEDDIELRRIKITNGKHAPVRLELTSYAELALALPASDAAHPAFSKLFVQTELLPGRQAILATRRPRSAGEQTPWMFSLLVVHGTTEGEASFETDRGRFIGRARTLARPAALERPALSGSAGSVLDPVAAIRRTVLIEPEETAVAYVVSGVAETREAALGLIEKYHDRHLGDRVFDLAWTHGQVVLQQLNVTEADAQIYGRLGSAINYLNPAQRAPATVLTKNHAGQSRLWGYGISGDLPIVLLQIHDRSNLELVRHLVQAHAYWRTKGLSVDLVIFNEDSSGYRQVLQDAIMGVINIGAETHVIDRPGGIFVRRAEQVSEGDRILFQSVARAVISDNAGSLADQVRRRPLPVPNIPELVPIRQPESYQHWSTPRRELLFDNGLGGFTPDGREYVITSRKEAATPAPWSNVLANAEFGTLLTESGLGYTWAENAQQYRLTSWYNDPVTDAAGEAMYIRDEETGAYWSPTPLPARGELPYVCRHGFGYTVFEHLEQGIRSELWVYVAQDAPVKFAVLKLRNESTQERRLTASYYVEWVLGERRPQMAPHVITELDPGSGALLARNRFVADYYHRVSFLDANMPVRNVTGDRREFLGRNGTLSRPAAMKRVRLSGRVGAGFDPCGALQVLVDLAPAQEREIVFKLGSGRDAEEAYQLLHRFRGTQAARQELERTWDYWKRTLGTVYVESPDRALDMLANGWLLYQVQACRLWARTGYYQSAGAFGFRDQLQDVTALLYSEPGLAREHLLRCAAHQFVEGDVQHWWHPPTGRGVRTRFSDDYLWLAYAVCRYVDTTGDTGVLEETAPFLEGRALQEEEEAYFDVPVRSEQSASLYDHCVRAIRHSASRGDHGLPLMGSGDWNDGMNLVGAGGKGESVWLGFFLYDVLTGFARLAEQRGDATFAAYCRGEAELLRSNIETHAWDGEWYLRAFFDDGQPLGSHLNEECQIDALPQSWAVLSGAGDPERRRKGMAAADLRLVDREHGLIRLLYPPFDKAPMEPGYIKGYVPGVRENGGQYTHAAVWVIMAFAMVGDDRRVAELLALINPVNHGATREGIATYKVEPYVAAADVYGVAPHEGRGGWTWYTGSAGWLYRLILEHVLGFRKRGEKLHFTPCIPPTWPGYRAVYRYGEAHYAIEVVRSGRECQVTRVTVDGEEQPDHSVPLLSEPVEHQVRVELG